MDKRRLFFENEAQSQDDSAASGHNVQKSKRGRKLRRENDRPQPSERLRHEDAQLSASDTPPPEGEAVLPDKKAVREAKKLNKSKFRMEKSAEELDAARKKLAAQRPPKKNGPVKSVGKSVKSEAWAVAHGKMYQVENENVGIKAAHRTELAGEGVARGVSRFVKRRIRTRPARRVRKWEMKDLNARADHAMRTAAQEHPDLKSNAASRFMQKQRIKRQYQNQARDTAKQGARFSERAAAAAKRIGSVAFAFVKDHPTGVMIVLLGFMLIVILQSCMAGAFSIGNGILGAVGGTSYLADDMDINMAELVYTQWETDLTLEAKNAEQSHPGYDEYRFDIDPTGHDPHALIAYLTIKYDDFTFAGIEAALREIFDQQYSLTFTEIVEVRYRTDPDTGEKIPYDYYILETKLTARPFMDVIGPLMAEPEEQDRYDGYTVTKGNRQYVDSPFPFNWLPYVSCQFGWRVHPITGKADFHRAIDIAVSEGTPIHAGGKGVVVLAETHPLYGLTVKIDYGGGITARYSHCSALLVSVGQMVEAGDVIARVGSTGEVTGPHLDLEVMKDGELLNPLYFVVIPN